MLIGAAREMTDIIKPPFPWFGGKSRVAHLVWPRFGNVLNYVEPFAGSLAVLFGRPTEPGVETVNDKDCFLANFWRATSIDADEVAYHADWPVNEADLHARHQWLVNQSEFVERMKTDPDYYNAKIAGWWVWGICQWIGNGWCDVSGKDLSRQLPHLGNAGKGMHRQLPHLGDSGRGVHRQLPHLGNVGQGVHRKSSNDSKHFWELHNYFHAIQNRLRKVRVACGDWTRVLGPSPTVHVGLTGVFLDPPYSESTGRDREIYSVDDISIASEVRDWAVAHGDNPMLRIALCGYAGEHEMPASWEDVAWTRTKGYAGKNGGHETRERIWFSPHCLRGRQSVLDFGGNSEESTESHQ
jgi:hypothetical protein